MRRGHNDRWDDIEMTTFSNELTPAEVERLALLAEECGEVVQIIGKILRHGYESRNPLIDNSPTNRQLLEEELGNIAHAVDRMMDAADLSGVAMEFAKIRKAMTVSKWLHHQDGA